MEDKIFKLRNWILKITWNSALFGYNVRKMERSYLQRRIYFCDIYGSLQGFWYYKSRPSFSKTKTLWLSAFNLLYSYLKYRKQKVVINNKTNSSEVVIAGVQKGSNDGQLLFNLFINDLILFLYTTVLSNYADDSNLYAIGNDKEETKKALAEHLSDRNYLVLWKLYDFKYRKMPLYVYG